MKTMALVRQVTSAAREREEIRASLLRLETEEEALAPWSSLDVPLRSRGTKTTAVFAGTLPGEWTAAALEGRAEPIPLSVEIVSVLQDQTCLFAVCLKRDREAAEQFLRSLGFAAPAAAGITPPSERREGIGRERRELAQREEELQKELAAAVALADSRHQVKQNGVHDSLPRNLSGASLVFGQHAQAGSKKDTKKRSLQDDNHQTGTVNVQICGGPARTRT